VCLIWSGNKYEYLQVKLYTVYSLLKNEFFDILKNSSAKTVIKIRADSTNMDKLTIIHISTSNELVLKLQHTSIPLLQFTNLHPVTPNAPIDLPLNIKYCIHNWIIRAHEQTRKGDEAATTVMQCTKCHKRKLKS
jgi:DNA-directed RNA polymerase subunit M/transcription elongation factor TFIIS